MKKKTTAVQSLYELYTQLNIKSSLEQHSEMFTILNLADVGFQLPYQSSPFRPNYFSFLFIKNGEGSYTIDEHTFEVAPHSIYFTNPSNYRTFSWRKIEEIFLITFNEEFLTNYISPDVYTYFPFLLTETLSPKKATLEFYNKVEFIYLCIDREYRSQNKHKFRIIGHLLAVILYEIKEYFWTDYSPIYEGNRQSQIVKLFKQEL